MNENISLKYAFLQPFVPPSGLDNTFVLFELEGKSLKTTSRTPINLSIVLDRSGSMSGKPLHYCKEATKYVLNHLTGNDLLNLVVFDSYVQTIFPPQEVTHKDLMKQKINQIETGGMTNLSGGLIQGCQHILKQDIKQYVNRVLLLSDGEANKGVTNHEDLMKIVDEYQLAGAQISTMGVSEHFNEELMEGLADHGKGNYYFINQVEEIPAIFAKELDSLLSVIAQKVQFIFKPKEGIKIKNIYGYNYTGTEEYYQLALGDIYSSEVKSILVECSLPAKGIGLHDIFDIEWSFVDVSDGINDYTFKLNIPIEYTSDVLKLSEVTDSHIVKQVEITKSAKALEDAMKLFDNGNFDAGKELLYNQAKQMSEKAAFMNDKELMKESQELFSQLENFEYSKKRRKELHNQKYRQMKRKKQE
jgi:Ca-activated chloride channel homolog